MFCRCFVLRFSRLLARLILFACFLVWIFANVVCLLAFACSFACIVIMFAHSFASLILTSVLDVRAGSGQDIYGDSGSSREYFLRTCGEDPILIHSFNIIGWQAL